ncbi:MAG: hypothetical protein KGH77_02630 [Candidatus Micrarchaeota archaeon]|nr:hypothetical protein [Candidatus Micrarchaeota archaeon]MDE1864298.1 hypothetical protein [Candidatus Micrarchaeota archaeon]
MASATTVAISIAQDANQEVCRKEKTPKYGSLSRAFSDIQLQRFLHVIGSDRFRLLFRYQAQLGLRIG